MADFYVDHGAYAAQGSLGLNNPTTWGVPQDGDGASKDAATAAATAFVSFSATPTSGTISVCGVSISTTGVLNAASADAAANTLAANINATTTTVAAGVAAGTPQLRNLVYARGPSGGASAGTCQIMSRVGSVKTNYSDNTNWLIAHTLNNSTETAGNRQFAGGSGGCFGCFVNPTAIGASSSIAAGTYGIAVAKPMVSPLTAQALFGPTDRQWVRTGNNPTISMASGVSFQRATTIGFPLNLVFDSNKKWTTDGASGVLTLALLAASSAGINFYPSQGANDMANAYTSGVSWSAVRKGGVVVTFKMVSAGYAATVGYSTQVAVLDLINIIFKLAPDTAANSYFRCGHGSYASGVQRYRNCRFDATAITSAVIPNSFISLSGYMNQTYAWFQGCDFLWTLNGTPADTTPIVLLGDTQAPSRIRFEDCSFSSGTSAKLKFATSNGVRNYQVTAIRCTGVTLGTSYQQMQQRIEGSFNFAGFQSRESGREFRYETTSGVVSWQPGSGYPTLSATQPDGTSWAIKAEWSSIAYASGPVQSLDIPSSVIENQLVDGIRTIKVRLLAPTTISNDLLGTFLSALLTYTDTSGKAKGQMAVSAITDSSATWTNAASYPNHSAREIILVTEAAVEQYTDLVVDLSLIGTPPTGVTEVLYFDPEFEVT